MEHHLTDESLADWMGYFYIRITEENGRRDSSVGGHVTPSSEQSAVSERRIQTDETTVSFFKKILKIGSFFFCWPNLPNESLHRRFVFEYGKDVE